MAQIYPCDFCGTEQSQMTITDQNSGDVQFVGLNCLPMFGMGVIISLPVEVLDAALGAIGYQPTAKLKKDRAAADAGPDESTRTIATVTETGPADNAGESLDGLGDSEIDQQVDKAITDHDESERQSTVNDAIDQQAMANAIRADDPSDPAPY